MRLMGEVWASVEEVATEAATEAATSACMETGTESAFEPGTEAVTARGASEPSASTATNVDAIARLEGHVSAKEAAGAERRARQAEKDSLKAEIGAFEAKLGRKLKNSDLAAYPDLAAKYARFKELRASKAA